MRKAMQVSRNIFLNTFFFISFFSLMTVFQLNIEAQPFKLIRTFQTLIQYFCFFLKIFLDLSILDNC